MVIRGECLVCAETFITNNISALPCGHVFHADCIQRWFERTPRNTCPNCRTSTATNQIVRHLFLDACDDQNVDELAVTLRETRSALSRADEKIRELENDKKELEVKLALELGKVTSLDAQIYDQNRQLDEASNLQCELIEELCGEREQLRILREKESDCELRIQNLVEQLRISKKNENDARLQRTMEERLRISEENEHSSSVAREIMSSWDAYITFMTELPTIKRAAIVGSADGFVWARTQNGNTFAATDAELKIFVSLFDNLADVPAHGVDLEEVHYIVPFTQENYIWGKKDKKGLFAARTKSIVLIAICEDERKIFAQVDTFVKELAKYLEEMGH